MTSSLIDFTSALLKDCIIYLISPIQNIKIAVSSLSLGIFTELSLSLVMPLQLATLGRAATTAWHLLTRSLQALVTMAGSRLATWNLICWFKCLLQRSRERLVSLPFRKSSTERSNPERSSREICDITLSNLS